MLSNCSKCRKNRGNENPKVVKTKKRRIMLSSKCAVYDIKKPKFVKE